MWRMTLIELFGDPWTCVLFIYDCYWACCVNLCDKLHCPSQKEFCPSPEAKIPRVKFQLLFQMHATRSWRSYASYTSWLNHHSNVWDTGSNVSLELADIMIESSHHFHECNHNLGYCSYNCLPKTLSRSFVYLSMPAIHGTFLLTFKPIVKLLVLAQLNQQPPMQHHPLEACYDSILHEPQLSWCQFQLGNLYRIGKG